MLDRSKYQIIYADPPWRQTKGGKRKCRPHQGRALDYPVLSLKDIETILSKFDSKILFLWTIDKYLFEAQQIGEQLGFKLHARFVWDKTNGIAPAFTIRYSHEYLLWMYKSPMLQIATKMRGKITTVFRERARQHSRKPEIAYKIIESFYPEQRKIELFARQKRKGWDAWGNEI